LLILIEDETFFKATRRKKLLSLYLKAGSVSGKRLPMSGRPPAERRASVKA
jgi:hypothetical protein